MMTAHLDGVLSTVARTIAATCVHVELVLSDARDDDLAADGLGVLIDGAGRCLILVGPGSVAPRGQLRAICRSDEPSLGQLHLSGRCGRPLPTKGWSDALEGVWSQRPGWRRLSEGREPAESITIRPLELDVVALAPPVPSGATERVLDVPVGAYVRAEPDPWLGGGPRMARWLEDHRQGELRMVAERAGAQRPSSSFADVVVTVDEIAAGRMDVCLLSLGGVCRVRVPIPEDMACPCGVVSWLDDQVASAC